MLVQVRVKKAAYVKSSVSLSQCPKPKLPEFAVIGRSNVGKSSLINMLTGQGALAKVSKTPGALSALPFSGLISETPRNLSSMTTLSASDP